MQNPSRNPIENPLPIPELLARAERGDTECLYWAGLRYFQGEGVPRDRRRAVEYCGQAALQFHVRAITFIAYCRFHGIELRKDLKLSILLYRFAAAEGYAPAQQTLGSFYLAGKVLRKNVRLARKWLGKAAAQGDRDALVRLGDLYHEGKDVVEDDEKASGYYRQAAELGSPEGQYMFGSFLMKGVAVERNPVEALELLDQAALQGYEPAVKMQTYFEEFVHFDPEDSKPVPVPLDHPIPVRRRTAVTAVFIQRPCFRAMARDLYDFAEQYGDNRDAALNDAAVLIRASVEEQGATAMTFLV